MKGALDSCPSEELANTLKSVQDEIQVLKQQIEEYENKKRIEEDERLAIQLMLEEENRELQRLKDFERAKEFNHQQSQKPPTKPFYKHEVEEPQEEPEPEHPPDRKEVKMNGRVISLSDSSKVKQPKGY